MKKTTGALVLLMIAAILAFAVGIAVFYPLPYRRQIVSAAKETGIEAALVASLIRAESGFNANAVSMKGAVGLMQLMPSTAAEVAQTSGYGQYLLTEPTDNIMLGCMYFAGLLDRYEGRVKEALAAYNAGYGRVDQWLNQEEYAVDGRLIKIPFKETDAYCKKVMNAVGWYRFRLGSDNKTVVLSDK